MAHHNSSTAATTGTEECLLLPTGFASNLALPTALGRTNTAIFSDELNHASLVDGARLAVSGRSSTSVVHVYRHGDVGDLERKMEQEAHTGAIHPCDDYVHNASYITQAGDCSS